MPGDYDGLCETQRVCEVHQNLLSSQHAVLLKRKDRAQDLTKAVQDQFNSLANLHNETLARIMDRHAEVKYNKKKLLKQFFNFLLAGEKTSRSVVKIQSNTIKIAELAPRNG